MTHDRQYIFNLAITAIEFARAVAHAAKVESQRDEIQLHKSFRQGCDDLVIHRAAHRGQRVCDHCDGAWRIVGQVRDALEVSGCAGEGEFFQGGHLSWGI
jgi:hypothetical protein